MVLLSIPRTRFWESLSLGLIAFLAPPATSARDFLGENGENGENGAQHRNKGREPSWVLWDTPLEPRPSPGPRPQPPSPQTLCSALALLSWETLLLRLTFLSCPHVQPFSLPLPGVGTGPSSKGLWVGVAWRSCRLGSQAGPAPPPPPAAHSALGCPPWWWSHKMEGAWVPASPVEEALPLNSSGSKAR